jgi:hypothetical protein
VNRPQRYRTRATVEAWQVTEDNVASVAQWAGGEFWGMRGSECVWLEDEETDTQQRVRPGAYVVRGVTGRFFRVDAEGFADNYEETPE